MDKESEQQRILEETFEQVFGYWLEGQPRLTDVAAIRAIAWPFFVNGYKRAANAALKPIADHVYRSISELQWP